MANDPDRRTVLAKPPPLLPLLGLEAVAEGTTASLTELGAVSSSAPAAAAVAVVGRYRGTGYVEEGAPSGGACGCVIGCCPGCCPDCCCWAWNWACCWAWNCCCCACCLCRCCCIWAALTLLLCSTRACCLSSASCD